MSSEFQRSEPRLIRLREAYRLLDVSDWKGNQLVRQGRLPGLVVLGPRCKRVRRSELIRWLENGEEGREA